MLKVQDLFEKILLTLLLGLCTGAVGYMKDMASSVSKLNEKIAIVIGRMEFYDLTLKSQDEKIRALETKRSK